MTTNVITIGPEKPVEDIARLLIERHISATPVVDARGGLLGIVSEGDLVHRVLGDHELPRSWWLSLVGDPADKPREYLKSHGQTAKDVMTADVVSVGEYASIAEIAELLETKRIKRVPVVENGKLVGIVSRANILQALVAGNEKNLPKVATSDQEIRSKILEELGAHNWASASTLNVVVNDGIVRLWGFVGSEEAKDAVRLAAESTAGVKQVENNLGVSPKVPEYL